ncbi:MAG: holo-ACP synthase [Alphaproteobacteria bacterium]|nr:holo-ACP synthase [Alphaproteobacteria bacterium]
MILGLGCDIINIERLFKSNRFLHDFKNKILGENELNELNTQIIDDDKKFACILAKRYAAKEAFAKALGCGFRDGLFLKNIETLHDKFGKPYLKISGEAQKKLNNLSTAAKLHISLSDDYPYAQATVIIEG